MAIYTSHYNLKKPAASDYVSVADLNGNADIIDAKLYSAISSVTSSEEASTTAAAAHAVGSYFWLSGVLYRTTAAIAIGDTITAGTNCTAVTILGEMENNKPHKGSISFSTTWSGNGPYTQTVTVTGATVTSDSMIDLEPDATALNQLISDGVTALFVTNNSGTLTATAIGAPTTSALTIQCTVTEVTT